MIAIVVDKKDNYKFILKAEDGNVLLNSVSFSNESEVKKTVQSLTLLQQKRSVFERKTNHIGEFLFHMKNLNGKVIGTSEPFGSEAGMENGIKNLKKRIIHLSKLGQL